MTDAKTQADVVELPAPTPAQPQPITRSPAHWQWAGDWWQWAGDWWQWQDWPALAHWQWADDGWQWQWQDWPAPATGSAARGDGVGDGGKGAGKYNDHCGYCSMHNCQHYRKRLFTLPHEGGRKRQRQACVPTHPCLKAPTEWECKLDPAVEPFHVQLLQLYASSSKGVLTKMFYVEAYRRLRDQHALPPPYDGSYPPRPKFVEGHPAPLIMWPHCKDVDDEKFWPQNGTPRAAAFAASHVDWFGFEWRNIYVYKGS
jgi:hypothetical protein